MKLADFLVERVKFDKGPNSGVFQQFTLMKMLRKLVKFTRLESVIWPLFIKKRLKVTTL